MRIDRSLLARTRPFRLCWLAGLATEVAAGVRRVAVPWLVYDLTGSSLQLGVSLALFTAPDALLAPVIGWAVDSRSRRRLLLAAAAGQALAFAGLAATHARGALSVPVLYATLAVLSVLQGTYYQARHALVPRFVDDDALDAANATVHGTTAAVSLAFVAVGGAVTGLAGPAAALAVAAAAAIASLPAIAALPRTPPAREGPSIVDGPASRGSSPSARLRAGARQVRAGAASIARTVREGAGYLLAPGPVRTVVLVGVGINLAIVPTTLLFADLGRFAFGSAIAYTVLLVAYRAGSLAGNAAVPRLDWPRERSYAIGVATVGLALLVLAGGGAAIVGVSTGPAALAALAVLVAVVGAGNPLYNVPSDSLVQAAAPDEVRGTVVTLANAALQLPFPVAYVLAGALAERTSPFVGFALGGGLLTALGALALVRFDAVDPPTGAVDADVEG